MKIPGVHDPDPEHPLGMAWWFAAGVCDPRPGGYPKQLYPNQQWCLKQSWEPTSQLMWDLGFRWHPELATRWLQGGGQFGLAEIVDKQPEEPDMDELIEQFAEDQFEQMKQEIERVKQRGTPYEQERLKSRYKMAMRQNEQLVEMLGDVVKDLPDEADLDKHNRKGYRIKKEK
jgi:hypothetical protein